MRIIKQFDDFDFFERHHYLAYEDEELKKGYWRWGLGDDGELYCQSYGFPEPEEWHPYPEVGYGGKLLVTFDEMRKIVKEFGHLVIFT
jgi:hypothetical protein